MFQLSKVPVKTEPTEFTSIDKYNISNKKDMDIVKLENNYLFNTEIDIKEEPCEEENEISTSNNMRFQNNVKYESINSNVQKNEFLNDSLYVSNLSEDEKKIQEYPTFQKVELNTVEDWYDYYRVCRKEIEEKKIRENENEQEIKLEKNEYSCHICKKEFYQKCNLEAHFRIHTGIKPYKCNICEKSFIQKSNLDSHYRIHTDEKPHLCSICNSVFKYKINLKRHYKVSHSDEKPYSCDQCDKKFSLKQYLISHKRSHSEDKPFDCDLCPKSFKDKSTLTKHK